MKKILFSISLMLGAVAFQAQVKVGANAQTEGTKDYVGLSVSSNTKQGFMPPVVVLTDIADKVLPIKNPVEGMLVYNLGSSTVQQGMYVWNAAANGGNGIWVQLADTSNIISTMTMVNSQPFKLLANAALGDYQTLNSVTYNKLTDKIGAEYDANGLTLVANSGYVITVALNIKPADAAYYLNNNGLAGTHAHLHKYILALKDTNGNIHGTPVRVSSVSGVGANDNVHTVYATFAFPIVLTKVTLFPHIAYEKNASNSNEGTYYPNQPAGNSGAIEIVDSKIYIERGILAL